MTKQPPTGFVAKCRCGSAIGAMDYDRTERTEAARMLGKWLMDGCTVEPRFGDLWSEELTPCKCEGGVTA